MTFGMQAKIKLLLIGKTQKWLAETVTERTGLYCDECYISKILSDKIATRSIVSAVREILELEEEEPDDGERED